MATEPKLLVSLVQNVDTVTFMKLNPSDFRSAEGLQGYTFIQDYWKQYQQFPTAQIFKESLPHFPHEVAETNPDFLYHELKKQNTKLDLYNILNVAGSDYQQEKDPITIVEDLFASLRALPSMPSKERVLDIKDSVDDRFSNYTELASTENKEILYTFGHPMLDDAGNGFQPGNLGLILARLGVGKTWYAIYLAYRYWKRGLKPLFVSMEMSETEVGERFDAIAGKMSFAKMKKGELYPEQLQNFIKYKESLKENPHEFKMSDPDTCTISKL